MNLTKVYVAITMTTVLIATYFSVTCEEKLVPIVEMGIQKEEPSSSLIQTSESMLSNTPESDSATSSIQTLSVTVLRTPNAAPNASSTSEIVPILPAPSVPSNAGFVIALAWCVWRNRTGRGHWRGRLLPFALAPGERGSRKEGAGNRLIFGGPLG